MAKELCDTGRTKKRILVTGGNSGIGKALIKKLVDDYDCRVYMGVRHLDKGEDAVDDLC